MSKPLVGVLALQGAFEEHQQCLEAVGCRTRQVRTAKDLEDLEGIVLPGGESTAMGLIGNSSSSINTSLWQSLQEFSRSQPTWGTCAGMILLAEKCIGASAVIQDGQALIGGVDITVCRNYFGSQVSSFEMDTQPPPLLSGSSSGESNGGADVPFPGVFIRAPAILSAGPGVQVLGSVVATPCRQAAVILHELQKKIEVGENVVQMGVVDSLERNAQGGIQYKVVMEEQQSTQQQQQQGQDEEEKKEGSSILEDSENSVIRLPGAANGTTARRIISAVRRDNLLCTAFHPEITTDLRWHEYFVKNMVLEKNK